METEPSQRNRSIIFGITGLAIGLVIGLVVLGWWLFPVQWVDFSPEQMGAADQEEYLRMAIDSLSVNYDTTAAISRYLELGADGPAILATIQIDPEPQSQKAVQAFSALVQAQPEPADQSAASVMQVALIVLLVLVILALAGFLGYSLLRRRSLPTEVKTSTAEFPPELSQPGDIMGMDITTDMEETSRSMAEIEQEEFGAPETEIEITEFENEGGGMGALAVGVGAVAAVEAIVEAGSDDSAEVPPDSGGEVNEPIVEAEEILEEGTGLEGLGASAAVLAATQIVSDSEMADSDETVPGMAMEAEPEDNTLTDVAARFPTDLEYIEGVGPAYAEKLKEIGINTPEQLLQWGANPRGRQAIAERSEISAKLILKWINHIDLYRVKGIGSEYAELLEQSGVDTVVELATRNPANLYQTLVAVNESKKLVRKLPVLAQVEDWVLQAQELPRILTY